MTFQMIFAPLLVVFAAFHVHNKDYGWAVFTGGGFFLILADLGASA